MVTYDVTFTNCLSKFYYLSNHGMPCILELNHTGYHRSASILNRYYEWEDENDASFKYKQVLNAMRGVHLTLPFKQVCLDIPGNKPTFWDL